MKKKENAQAAKIFFMFLSSLVIALFILGMATISFAAKASSAIVDINTADEKTLESLPGIGKTTAKEIIAGRPYKDMNDLKRVKGMSDKRIKALKGKVSVGGSMASAATTAASQKVSAAEKKADTAKKKVADSSAAIVDINTADEKTLESLPGVGKATAKAIVAGRPYKSADDLKRVKGMSDKKIQALQGKISVSGAAATSATSQKMTAAQQKAVGMSATASQKAASAEQSATKKYSQAKKKLEPGQRININTASKEDLELLPGIGPSKAQAIMNARPYEKPEDIMKVKGIKQKSFEKLQDYITVR